SVEQITHEAPQVARELRGPVEMGTKAEHCLAEDARLRAESRRGTEGRGADCDERTEAECHLGEQGATNGGQHAGECADASHDAREEHEAAGEAAHGP